LYLKRDALNSGLSDVVCVKGFSYACLVSLRTVVDSVGGDGRKYVVAGQAVLGVAEENLKFVFDTLPTMRWAVDVCGMGYLLGFCVGGVERLIDWRIDLWSRLFISLWYCLNLAIHFSVESRHDQT
jgi:hypothetical protein